MYQIPVELLQAVLNYLGTKPYAEVLNLVPGLLKLSKIESVEPPKE